MVLLLKTLIDSTRIFALQNVLYKGVKPEGVGTPQDVGGAHGTKDWPGWAGWSEISTEHNGIPPPWVSQESQGKRIYGSMQVVNINLKGYIIYINIDALVMNHFYAFREQP